MSGRFVRQSSYRHVHGVAAKSDKSFLDIRPQTNGDGAHVTGNDKFLAFASQGGGGPLIVHPLDKPGRLGMQTKKIMVHKSTVLDFQFHPFISSMIATGSEDCYVKVTKFPSAGLENDIKVADVTLEGHQKKVTSINFSPTANNILATTSHDKTVKIWDIEAQSEVLSFDDHKEVPCSFDWNTDGSLAATSCKDKMVRIYDPRKPKESCLTGEGPAGTKKSSILFLDNHGLIATVGFTRNSARQYLLYDPKKFDKPIATVDIDQSAGVFIAKYDPDTSMLYLAGKGDASIKYFEIVSEAPYVHFLSEYSDSQTTKGIGWLPKTSMDTSKCEVARALRLSRDQIQPISFQVPRKSDMFQADIFPDTYAGVPALNATEWLAGENKPPAMQSMDPKKNGGAKQEVAFSKKKSPKELQAELDVANARIKELEAEVAKLKGN